MFPSGGALLPPQLAYAMPVEVLCGWLVLFIRSSLAIHSQAMQLHRFSIFYIIFFPMKLKM